MHLAASGGLTVVFYRWCGACQWWCIGRGQQLTELDVLTSGDALPQLAWHRGNTADEALASVLLCESKMWSMGVDIMS